VTVTAGCFFYSSDVQGNAFMDLHLIDQRRLWLLFERVPQLFWNLVYVWL